MLFRHSPLLTVTEWSKAPPAAIQWSHSYVVQSDSQRQFEQVKLRCINVRAIYNGCFYGYACDRKTTRQ